MKKIVLLASFIFTFFLVSDTLFGQVHLSATRCGLHSSSTSFNYSHTFNSVLPATDSVKLVVGVITCNPRTNGAGIRLNGVSFTKTYVPAGNCRYIYTTYYIPRNVFNQAVTNGAGSITFSFYTNDQCRPGIGCSSANDPCIKIDLTVDTSCVATAGVDVQSACGSYTWMNGVTYTSSNNTAKDTLVNVAGCDSIVSLDLTIKNSTTGVDVQSACDSYTWMNGVTYTSSNNTVKDTLTNSQGCDSVITLNLTIKNSTSGVDVQSACGSYTWINGVTYTSSNNTAKDTLINSQGCDSVVTLNLTIKNTTTGIDVQSACGSYTWMNGVTYTSSNNTAKDTLVNAAGCDSVITLNLTIKNSTSGVDVQSVCGSYTWMNGVMYTSSNNTAKDTLVNAAGCDSVITLNLTIKNSTSGVDVQSACGSYTWMNGVTYTSSNNTAKDTLINSQGCDSVITLNLTIKNITTGVDVQSACGSYTWMNGVTYTSSNNTAKDTLVNAAGCDSVITLNLTIKNSTTGVDVQSACGSYTWMNGVTYRSSNNTAKDTLINSQGCDSVVTLNLTIKNTTTGIDVQSACGSYTWMNGVTYTSSNNTAKDTLVNAAGCDSIVTLNLTVNQVNTSVSQTGITLTANAIGASYQWVNCNTGYSVVAGETGFSFLPTVNADYAVIVTQNGCIDTSACHRIYSVSINQNNIDNEVLIYPNPNSGLFTLELLANTNKSIYVQIIDVSGKIIAEGDYAVREKIAFDLSERDKGIYFLQLKTNFGTITKKIVIQ